MLNSVKNTALVISISSLCACATYNPGGYTTSLPSSTDHGTELYPEGYENTGYSSDYHQQVSVPDSYHVSSYHPPEKSKNVDEQWVGGQNPTGYTIEVADGDKASSVANTLLQAPKNERKVKLNISKVIKPFIKACMEPTQPLRQRNKHSKHYRPISNKKQVFNHGEPFKVQ
jgi:hypothetical protein